MKMVTTAILLAFSLVSVNASAKAKMTPEQRAKVIKAAKEQMEKSRGQHGNKF